MSAIVRTSLADTLFEFLETSNSDKQIREMRDKMEQQKRNSGQLINALRTENGCLKEKMKRITENSESLGLKESNTDLKKKITELTDELKNSKEKRSIIESDLSSALTNNAILNATVTRMQKSNVELTTNMKNIESTNANLINTNKILTDNNNKLTANMDNLTVEYNYLMMQLKEANNKCESIKSEAWDQCAKTVQNTKKQQWCATCGTPGGRYYCSTPCEGYQK